MIRRGLTKTGSRSPSEPTATARTDQVPSETAPTPPTAAQALQQHELVFVPRSCQGTRRSRHLFRIAYPTVVFIILPLPERPRNALTSTLTLSGSFLEHLNGGWFRNRFVLSCVLVLCASACFFTIREEIFAFFSSIVFCPVLRPAIPRFSLHLLTSRFCVL